MKLLKLINLSKKWIRDELFPSIKNCGRDYDKMIKSNKIKNPCVIKNHFWFLINFLVHSILSFSFWFLIKLSHFLFYHCVCVCDSKKISVCEVEEGCTFVKKKFKQWIIVENQLMICLLMCFSLIS
jgi:hypothetical protein